MTALAAKTIINTLPTVVAAQIKVAAQTINKMQSSLAQARNADQMFKGEGRYEGELIHYNYGGSLKFFTARDEVYSVLDKWEAYAKDKDISIDWDALKQELNIPLDPQSIYILSEGFNYALDLAA